MKLKPILTTLCTLAAGFLIACAATEPRTHASPEPTPVVIPKATVTTPPITPVEEPETAPPLVVEVAERVPSPPAFVAPASPVKARLPARKVTCSGGTCSVQSSSGWYLGKRLGRRR